MLPGGLHPGDDTFDPSKLSVQMLWEIAHMCLQNAHERDGSIIDVRAL